jgi:hypothetical protein
MSGEDECEHEWTEDYVCSLCGHVKSGSAPLWVWELRGLKPGPRAVLLALWTVADRNTKTPRPVYPGNELLRRRANHITDSVLYAHLATLRKLGWIRDVEGRRRILQLAWSAPFAVIAYDVEGQTSENQEVPDSQNQEETSENQEVPDLSNPGPNLLKSGVRPPGIRSETPGIRTHTFQLPCTDLSVDLARAGQPALPGFVAEPAHAPSAQRKPKGSKSPTDEELIAWWAEVYLPLRESRYTRWRPEVKIQPLECSDPRIRALRSRLKSSSSELWPDWRLLLTHVVEVAAARVDKQRGQEVPYGNGTYDVMDNIGPGFWLMKPSRFQELLESPRIEIKPVKSSMRFAGHIDQIDLEELQ